MISSTNVLPAYLERIFYTHKPDSFDDDLTFIHQSIRENHPGIHNSFDPNFSKSLEENFDIAKQELRRASSDHEKARELQEFGRKFHDSHLWIQYDQKSAEPLTTSPTRVKRAFGIQEIKKGMHWVDIPTFAPSEDQITILNQIICKLSHLCDHTIVFDLRGNGGGCSYWGTEILNGLFSKEYVEKRLVEYNQDVFVEWRASSGNLEYIKSILPLLQNQFEENHPAIRLAKTVATGIEKALLRGESYYLEPKEEADLSFSPDAQNPFKGKVFAIVDEGCGSACLDFLDGLKAMKTNLVLVGKTTGADSSYMELRKIPLPSGHGNLGFPIKVYRNRPRGHNVPYTPDVRYDHLQDTAKLQEFVLKL